MNGRPAAGALSTGLAGVVLTLVALAVGTAPLLLAGIGLLVLTGVAALVVVPAGRGVTVDRRLSSRRVQEGETLDAVLIVRRGRRPLARIEIREALAAEPLAVPLGRRSALRVRRAAPRRGRHLLPGPQVVVSDPLGLFEHVRGGAGDTEVLVLPRLEPVRWAASDARRAAAGASPGGAAAGEPLGAGEIDGLRPYRPGTPATRIHWPALARGAGLLERQVRPAAEGWPLVVLDLQGAVDGERLDAAVRAAASLAAELARRGGVRLALPGERRPSAIGPDLVAWPAAHVRLALVGDGLGNRGLAPSATSGDRLFLVRGGELPSGCSGTQRETILVLPAGVRAPRPSPVLSVSGCLGYDISRPRRAAT